MSSKLLLVNPSARTENYGKLNDLSAIEPPLWCALLAGYVRYHGFNVEILDAEAEGLTIEQTAKEIVAHDPQLTAIIVMGCNPTVSSTPKMDAVIKLSRLLEGEKTKVLIGGLHPSALPKSTLDSTGADYVVAGEGFYTIRTLMTALQNGYSTDLAIAGLWERGEAIVLSKCPRLNDFELPHGAWDLLPMEKYRDHNWHCLGHLDQRSPYGVIATSFGCPFSCSYCNVHALYGDRALRNRPVSDVLAEIDVLVMRYGIRNLKIWDELFALSERRVLEFCDRLIEREYGLNIWCYGRVDTVTDRMIERMKKAGINWICYGFESANESVRRGANKHYSDSDFTNAVYFCRQNGMYILANFLFGLPDDTLETMEETLESALAANFEWPNFYCTAPMPGSLLYAASIKAEIPHPETWADYGQYSPNFVPLATKTLSGREVLAFRDEAFQQYFSRPIYLNMIEAKFGIQAREHIMGMLKLEVRRER